MIRVYRGKRLPRGTGLEHNWPLGEDQELIVEYEMGDRVRVQPELDPVSKTRQSHALETDVNKIVSRYRSTGVWQRNGRAPMYGDFSDIGSYHESLNRVYEMQEDFERLPAAVKKACSQDPGIFLEKVYTPEGREELKKLGLDGRSVPEKARVEPVVEEVVEDVEETSGK